MLIENSVKDNDRIFRSEKRRKTPGGKGYCGRCDSYKDVSEFSRNSQNPAGIMTHCKMCQRLDSIRYREKRRAWDREKNYGLSSSQYQAMLDDQGGVCAICGKPSDRIHKGVRVDLYVDHNHETGKVRGLLCEGCNSGIGYFRESADNLRKAIDYLARTK